MNTKIDIQLSDVQKTLFLPVWARAMESQKKKPVLVDETAVKIIDSVDFDFSPMGKNLKAINQISWVARCKRFDMIVNEFISKNPDGTIVNIGCGLDTSYERINNPSIRWYDLDLPEVIDLRRKFLTETANRKFIAGSFLDTQWLQMIPSRSKVLFIAAGVFVYFEEQQMKDFFVRLADNFTNAEIFFDATSPKGVEIANQVIKKSGLGANSFFKWSLADPSKINLWDNRLQLIKIYYTFKIEGLDLSFENKLRGFLSDSAGVLYMVHLKLEKEGNSKDRLK